MTIATTTTTTTLTPTSSPLASDSLDHAIARAARATLAARADDGRWDAEGDTGAQSTAQALVALHAAGALDAGLVARTCGYLRATQRDDGGWTAYPGAPASDLGATASAWAALTLAGEPASRDAASRAARFVGAHGGPAAVLARLGGGDAAAVFLAEAGLLPRAALPDPGAWLALAPSAERWVLRRVHAGVLMTGYALALLASPAASHARAPRWSPGAVARSRALAFITSFQNDDGSWNVAVPPTAVSLLALRAAGVPRADARVARAARWLARAVREDARGARFPAFQGTVWATSLNLRALLEALGRGGAEELAPSVRWLLASQCAGAQHPHNNPGARRVRTGGFAYDVGADRMPDCDDTGVALAALGALGAAGALAPPLAREADAACARGVAWLLGMQNADGGFAAYVRGLPSKTPGPAMTRPLELDFGDARALLAALRAPPYALSDPSAEDITGRVLHGLGALGHRADAPHVRRALAFLAHQQCASGAFWGRWTTNYLSATAWVVRGAAAVGARLDAPWLARAVRFLLARQRDDGAWGESVESYRDPSRAGVGPASAPLTGLVATALIDAGLARTDAVAHAARFLLARQRSDGTWDHDGYLAPIVPPDSFYGHTEAARHYPLEALARYRAAAARRSAS